MRAVKENLSHVSSLACGVLLAISGVPYVASGIGTLSLDLEKSTLQTHTWETVVWQYLFRWK